MWKALSAGIILPVIAAAEVLCALGSGAANYKPTADQRPTSDALEIARRMSEGLSPVCSPRCPEIPLFRNATAANVMLVINGDQAKVVYSPQFFQGLYDNYGEGAIIGVLAHEFGHALDDLNPGKFGRGGSPELRADAWAGCALARANLSKVGLEQALSALQQYPSPAHPEWPARMAALKLGFSQCRGDASKLDGGRGGSK